MFTYLNLIQLTPEGREHLAEAPKYLEKMKHFVEAEQGHWDSVWAMMGPYDFVALVRYPTIEAGFRALAKIGTLDFVTTETYAVEEVELFLKALV
jgi:uncharacterized protein with GYD domain